MNAKSSRLPTPEDLATERLVAAVESAIDGIQQRLPNLATDTQDAKWSVSDGDAKASRATGAGLLQLRTQLQGERPRTIVVRWVDNQPEPDTPNHRNKRARK
jgi:hypothetical protein